MRHSSNTNDRKTEQLDAIKKEGNWANETELDLNGNSKDFLKLYTKNIKKEDLARKILDQWNLADGKDYFSDKQQIQKANSYAEYIINFKGGKGKESKEESLEEKIKKFKGKKELTEDERKELQKLLDEKEKEWSQKQKKDPSKKSKDPLMQSLLDKLNDINDHRLEYKDEKIGKISTVALPGIPLPTFQGKSKEQDGVKETTITLGIRKLTYKARVRHHRLNRVAERFNKIGDEPKKGLNYIVAMCKKGEGGRPMAAILRSARSWLEDKDIMNNPEIFRQKVESQKKVFIDDITDGITRAEEKPSIDAIKARIDYFGQEYYLRMTSKLLGAKPIPPKKPTTKK